MNDIIEKLTMEIDKLKYEQADTDTKHEWDILEGKRLGLLRAIEIISE